MTLTRHLGPPTAYAELSLDSVYTFSAPYIGDSGSVIGPYCPVSGFHGLHSIGSMARSRGKDTATTRFRFAGMFTNITVSDLAPAASSVVPAPMSLFAPMRLSTPTIRKF